MIEFLVSFFFSDKSLAILPVVLAGLAAGAGSAIYGGIKSSKANKRMRKQADEENRFNTAVFKKDYYSDYVNRKDTQNLLQKLREMLLKNNEQTAATSRITGETEESQAAEKKRAQETLSDTISNIDAMSERYKDNVMNRYLNQRNATYNRNAAMNANDAQQANNLMSQGLRTLVNSASLAVPYAYDNSESLAVPYAYDNSEKLPVTPDFLRILKPKIPEKFRE